MLRKYNEDCTVYKHENFDQFNPTHQLWIRDTLKIR